MPGKIFFLLIATFVAMLGDNLFAQSSTANAAAFIPELKLNTPIEGDFASGTEQTFRLHLEGNQFAGIVLDQKGVNLSMQVEDAKDRKKLHEVDLNFGNYGYDWAVFANDSEPRDLLVRIYPLVKDRAASTHFSLELTELKTTDARDKLRFEAQKMIANAAKLLLQGKLEKSFEGFLLLGNGLKLARESGDSKIVGSALIFMQYAYNSIGNPQKSIEFGEEALQIFSHEKDAYFQEFIRQHIGRAHGQLGQTDKAIKSLNEALEISKQFGNDPLKVDILVDLSRQYLKIRDLKNSFDAASQARETAFIIGNKEFELRAFLALVNYYDEINDPFKKIEILNKALPISYETKYPTATLYQSIANEYANFGDLQKTLEFALLALEDNRRHSVGKFAEAIDLIEIARIYQRLGQGARRTSYINRAINALDGLDDKASNRVRLEFQGELHLSLKEYEKAREFYLQTLKLSQENKDFGLVSIRFSYTYLAYIERMLGNLEKALDYQKKVLEITQQIYPKNSTALDLNSVAALYIDLGQIDKAEKLQTEALEIARRINNRKIESNALYGLARIRRSQKNLAESRKLIEDSLKIEEAVRSDLISQEARSSYFSTVRNKYDFYISLLVEMQSYTGSKDGNEENLALAFAVSERSRARGLLNLLTESYTNTSAGIDPQLRERERSTGARISSLQSRIIKLKSAEKQDDKLIAELQNQLEDTDEERQNIEVQIRRTNSRYAALKYPTTLDLKATQDLLDDETVLLEYHVSLDSSFLFAISKTDYLVIKLPAEKIIRADVERLHKSISTPARTQLANYMFIGSQLYQTLVAPVEKLLNSKKKIIIAADGALNYLPFEVLLKTNTKTSLDKLPYLVRDFEISYTPSATVLFNLKRGDKNQKPAKSFLAFAAPDYEAQATDENLISDSKTRSVFGENRKWKLTDLPFAKLEATRIAKLFPAGQSAVFSGNQATEERAKSPELLNQYRYLHFAVHGLIDEEQPQFSSIILSLPNTSDQSKNTEDGLLQTPEIFNLKLNADLVTLSACETGLGQEMRGEGIVGLTRAFFYAGTPSVLVSLWKVDDASTSDLMISFYENLRKNGERNKSAALRETQLKLIGSNRYSHPYYWSAFILQGRPNSGF